MAEICEYNNQKEDNSSNHLIIMEIMCWAIGLMSGVFDNGPGDWGSIPGQIIPKTQKMVLDAALLNTWHYKV